MAESKAALQFEKLISVLAGTIIHNQARLNREHNTQLAAFIPVLKAATALGYGELARAIAPSVIAASRMEIEIGFHFARSTGGEFSLQLKPLNIGYTRKYAYSEFSRNNVQFTVERIPFPPQKPKGE